ncbi:hypothetical protein AXG93_4605s1050 [Marchantia polymorpha subsp. ruderalis]|uniref:Uncharacterized protein n=1 Tax=Marchantia polymorpha subsp. ruderalis TaxID=1480154 RepID=A0A176WN00_MARPO|nr:hypothetical protein AXG93_4605s1050 [Marchantia polymorpha subsp. ruderalis]
MNHVSKSNSPSMQTCVDSSLNSYLAVEVSNVAGEELKEFVGDIESVGKGKQEGLLLQPEFLSQVPQDNACEHVLFEEEKHARKLQVEELYFDNTRDDLRQRWQVLSQNQDLLWHKKRVFQLFGRVMMLLEEKLSCAKEVEKLSKTLSEEKCLDQSSLTSETAAFRHDSSPSLRALNFDIMHKRRSPSPTHGFSQEIRKGTFNLQLSDSSPGYISLTTSTSSGSPFLQSDRGGVARGPAFNSVGEPYFPCEWGMPSKQISSKVATMSLPLSVQESRIKDPPYPIFFEREASHSFRKFTSSEGSQVPFDEFKGSSNSSSTQHSSPDYGFPIRPPSFYSEDYEVGIVFMVIVVISDIFKQMRKG